MTQDGKKNNGGPRIRFVSTVERFLTDPNVKTFTLGVILIVSLIKGWPVMCVLPLLQPEPYESLLGPSFWNLTVFIWTVTTRAPRQFLALTDTLILGLGFVAWALKDYNETQMVEDQMEFQMYGENEGKLSVAQKLKIGLEDRAVVGDVKAQFQMANLYAREGDILKATDWYRQAANHGNKEAQIALADCYAMGKGVARDEKMAVWWYEKAADQGVADAKIRLAMITDASNNVSVPSPSPHGLPMETKSSGPSVDIVDSKHMPDKSSQPLSVKEDDEGSEDIEPDDDSVSPAQRGASNLRVGTTFWGFISHGKLWRMPVKVEGKICTGVYPNFIGEWTAVGKVTCESQSIFVNVKEYGVVILGDRTTQAHLIFVAEGRMEGEVFQEGVSGGSAVLEVQFVD